MDPFTVLPSELYDYVLQHLSGEELIEKTNFVSKKWHSVISKSSQVMKKLQLNLFWPRGVLFNREIVEMLMASPRRYQTVCMRYQSLHIDSFKKILAINDRIWRIVTLERLQFQKLSELIEIIKIFEGTVEELKIVDIYVTEMDGMVQFNMPKLRKLVLSHADMWEESIAELFVGCKNLTEFQLISANRTEKATTALSIILNQNRNLKRLEMTADVAKIVLENRAFNFRLDSFKTLNFCHLKSEINIFKFLQNQVSTLQDFAIDEVSCPDTLKLLFTMPKLKHLTMGNIDVEKMNFDRMHLRINQSIETLIYRHPENKFIVMKRIVDAVPNVKHVEMFSLTQDMMEYLSLKAGNLEVLKLRCIQATNLSLTHLFPNVKEVKIDIVPTDVHCRLEKELNVDVNPFLRLLKSSYYTVLD